jgi:hypothetical protein
LGNFPEKRFSFSMGKKKVSSKMGQYYVIVNVTKKQFIDPHSFGDGAKLLEFCSSTEGMLLALSALLADGNGRGGGDIFCSQYRKEEAKYFKKKIKTFPNVTKFNSSLIGSWAGDRIVIAGDYADPRKFLTTKEIRRYQAHYRKTESPDRQRYIETNTNLYSVALAFYQNVSKEILAVLIDSGEIGKSRQDNIREFHNMIEVIKSVKT